MVYYKAKLLRKKYRINTCSGVDYLKMVIHKQGYNIIPYCESTLTLTALGLDKEAQTASALSVIDSNDDVTVYYNSSLPIAQQRIALAHELGHIELNHKHKKMNRSHQEKEADQFARYLLEDNSVHNLMVAIIGVMFILICLIIALLYIINDDAPVVSTSVITSISTHSYSFEETTTHSEASATNSSIISNNNSEPHIVSESTTSLSSADNPSNENAYEYNSSENVSNNSACYFTKYGEVYHLYPDCQYIRNANSVICDSINGSHKDRLCFACERRNNKKYIYQQESSTP